jgi:hypothetical protein
LIGMMSLMILGWPGCSAEKEGSKGNSPGGSAARKGRVTARDRRVIIDQAFIVASI